MSLLIFKSHIKRFRDGHFLKVLLRGQFSSSNFPFRISQVRIRQHIVIQERNDYKAGKLVTYKTFREWLFRKRLYKITVIYFITTRKKIGYLSGPLT